jgi:hypothetical protein
MVIVHGSGGVTKGEWEWANQINGLGIASFVIDNFTGRGIRETETDQFRLSPAADIAGALAALRLLATHPGIDPKHIGVIGFSRGGIVALDTALEPFRRAVIDGDLRFAAHIPSLSIVRHQFCVGSSRRFADPDAARWQGQLHPGRAMPRLCRRVA